MAELIWEEARTPKRATQSEEERRELLEEENTKIQNTADEENRGRTKERPTAGSHIRAR